MAGGNKSNNPAAKKRKVQLQVTERIKAAAKRASYRKFERN